jgi:hypothetical protein
MDRQDKRFLIVQALGGIVGALIGIGVFYIFNLDFGATINTIVGGVSALIGMAVGVILLRDWI